MTSIRQYAKEQGVSYRQARKALTGKVYEREHSDTEGARLYRRGVRNDFWVNEWRKYVAEDREKSVYAIRQKWRAMRIAPPMGNTHTGPRGKHHHVRKDANARATAFFIAMGFDRTDAESGTVMAQIYPETQGAGEEFAE